MFIAALFIIARTWKQPRCPSADEWIRKLWYIYTMEYYSAVKKNCKKAKWLSMEALQIAVKRREVKSKGEKERYKHLNAEFQRIARRDKKDGNDNPVCKTAKETQMYRTVFWTLWERESVG